MNIDPIPSEPETAADNRAQRTQRNLRALDVLVAIGVELTELVREQAKREVAMAAQLNEPAPDFTVALDRMARMVRRTVFLSEKLSEPAKALAPVRPAQDPVAAGKQVIRAVEDAIDRDAPAEVAASLHAEFAERLDSPEFADEIGARPAEEIIQEIRRDLGIAAAPGSHRWKRRTPADVARLCARAATLRPAAGPFVLPMPPGRWDCNNPLFRAADNGEAASRGGAGIRGP